ncbi:hypothetical protein BY996DRAFT_8116307 [Phakopsora pachyrhizi]|uniref:Expressed protein n=1 Tax=Phakopsora pachyrhizi TaxID=170000 RepID=A0AAV0AVJ2_PHAPC|nr:hypothetical protein BY996DRAFT_8116307 [Phakopsora pachyrhizi]CAH7672830.1 expressed protein [Phakopsora pachyrhizi]
MIRTRNLSIFEEILSSSTRGTNQTTKRLISTRTPSKIQLDDLSPSSSSKSSETIPKCLNLNTSSSTNRISLRERAGLQVFQDNVKSKKLLNHQKISSEQSLKDYCEEDGNSVYSGVCPTAGGPLLRSLTRNQAQRIKMNYNERAVAIDLLEDLNIPIEDLLKEGVQDDLTNQEGKVQDQNRPLDDNALCDQTPKVDTTNFYSFLKQQKDSVKSLSRIKPQRVSERDLWKEDVLKEIVDDQIKAIDSFDNELELMEWIDDNLIDHHQKLDQMKESFLLSSSDEINKSSSPTKQKLNRRGFSNGLGRVFEESNELNQLKHEDLCNQLMIKDDEDLKKSLLQKKFCSGPLLGPLLLHLSKVLSYRFENPNLSIYLYELIKFNRDPSIRYFGINNNQQLFSTIIEIRWKFFRDLDGIRDELIEMRGIGVELDESLRRLVRSIVESVVRDEIEAELKSSLKFEKTDDQGLSTNDNNLNEHHTFYGFERFRRYSDSDRRNVRLIENICFS